MTAKTQTVKHELKIGTATLVEMRDAPGRYANLAHWGRTCVVVTKNGKPWAAVVPLSILPELQEALKAEAEGFVIELEE